MSVWDVIIILVVFLAIVLGYFKGFARRLSEWVGMLIAIILAAPLYAPLNNFIETTFKFDGKEALASVIAGYFKNRVPVDTGQEIDSVSQWLSSLYLPTAVKESLFEAIDSSTTGIFGSIYTQLGVIVADPVWHIVLLIFATILVYTLLSIVGSLLSLAIPHAKPLEVCDRFLGAIFSAFMMVLVIGVVTSILIFVVPESAGTFGRWLHASAMGPVFSQAISAIFKGGFFI